MLFNNREDAGRRLATLLQGHSDNQPVIIALPRGGVPVAGQIAAALRAPLDVRVVKKIGVPGQPELALGAVTSNGTTAWNTSLVDWLHISAADCEGLRLSALKSAEKQEAAFRQNFPETSTEGRTVVVVDDGVATGMTLEAALRALRREAPKQIIVAAPVISAAASQRLKSLVNAIFALDVPQFFSAVGSYYVNFEQVDNSEVYQTLANYHPLTSRQTT